MNNKIKTTKTNLILLAMLPLALTVLFVTPNQKITTFNETNKTALAKSNITTNLYTIEQFSVGKNDDNKQFAGAIVNDGRDDNLFMIGENEYGELGVGTTDKSPIPLLVDVKGNGVVSDGQLSNLTLGATYSGIVAEDDINGDTLYTWGDNSHGQLGNGTANSTLILTPQEVNDQGKNLQIEELSFNNNSSAAIVNNDGVDEVYTWGEGAGNVLGTGNENSQTTPTKITMPTTYEAINNLSNNGTQMFVSTTTSGESDKLIGWGTANFGDGTSNLTTPTVIDVKASTGIDGSITDISGDFSSTGIVINDGTNDHILMTGDNSHGQLGTNDTETRATWTEILTDKNFDPNSVNLEMTFVNSSSALVDGQLYVWGDNSHGQLSLSGNSDAIKAPIMLDTSNVEGEAVNIVSGGQKLRVISDDGTNQTIYSLKNGTTYKTLGYTYNPVIDSEDVTVTNIGVDNVQINYQFDLNGSFWKNVMLINADDITEQMVGEPTVNGEMIFGSFELTGLNRDTTYKYIVRVDYSRPFSGSSDYFNVPANFTTAASQEPVTTINYFENTNKTATFKVTTDYGVAQSGLPWVVTDFNVTNNGELIPDSEIVRNKDGSYTLTNLDKKTNYDNIVITINYQDSGDVTNTTQEIIALAPFNTSGNLSQYLIYGTLLLIVIVLIICGLFFIIT